MAGVTTLDPIYWPLMDFDGGELPYCAVCGRAYPLNQHHLVWRSWGEMFRDGKAVPKPTLTLCGFGSNIGPGWCHGKAHHRMLHFRNDRGRLEFIEFERPTRYLDALDCDGWEAIGGRIWRF